MWECWDLSKLVNVVEDPVNKRAEDGKATWPDCVDPLTGVGNRRALLKLLDQYLTNEMPLSVILLDLDEFRVLNESLGHDFGDGVLQAAARRLQAVFDDHLFRPGGDEFVVVLPSGDPSQVRQIADTVLTKWRTPLFVEGSEIYSGISIGTVSRTADHQRANDLLRDAEIAMYEAKRLGRNRAVAFRSELKVAADNELETQMLGRRAVANREFHLDWQPLFDAQTGAVVSCEALLRWRPAGGLKTLSAAEFIPFLERSGLIIPVGKQVIDEAFQQYAQWKVRQNIPSEVPVSINISGRQLESGGVVDELLASMEDTGIDGSSLIVEIPERVMDKCPDPIRQDLQRLRDNGVRVAIDDFGGGQTSLLSLTDFPMDIVKLHRSATSQIVTYNENPILSSIHGLLKSQQLTTVVTGVESHEQLEWFQRRGWNWVQGFFVAKPAAADTITKLLVAQTRQRATRAS